MMMLMEVVNPVEPEPWPYELYKADSGTLRFQVRSRTGNGFANFSLLAKNNANKELYKILLGPSCRFDDTTKSGGVESKIFNLPQPIFSTFREFWLTWYNGVIRLSLETSPPFFEYADENITRNNIGYVKFYTMSSRWPVDWLFEGSPVMLKEIEPKMFEEGKLRWDEMVDGHLPPDALIGGFENEPLYIARAPHNGSSCPGKYMLSKKLAFVPWGGRAHAKDNFEILCGYNAMWVKTKDNHIPENAFIAGTSEIRDEPLYIGRAKLGNNLINGKVHVIHRLCYLPYKGEEIEATLYEILVECDVTPRGILASSQMLTDRDTVRIQW